MSVLIKGMEMPKSCLICVCDIPKGNCDLWRNQTPEEHRRERHPDCPLVEVPEPMKWIPVTERLPDVWEKVITFDKDEGVRENWRCGDKTSWSRGYHVTHWMPLQQPPESEGG